MKRNTKIIGKEKEGEKRKWRGPRPYVTAVENSLPSPHTLYVPSNSAQRVAFSRDTTERLSVAYVVECNAERFYSAAEMLKRKRVAVAA